jgi:signal transduction histidine kinase
MTPGRATPYGNNRIFAVRLASGKIDTVLGALSRRAVLRAGYAAILAVLVFAAVEAYRIQSSVSEQHLEIYRRYVDQDANVAILRRNLWLANLYVRDFFIQTTPEQAAALAAQLDGLRAEDDASLDKLARIGANRAALNNIRRRFADFRAIIEPLPRTMLAAPDEQQFEYLQREIVPRRGDLYNALLAIQTSDQQRLQESEREFAAARRNAARRLLIILGLCVLLAIAVARLSLLHAENLERRAEQHFREVELARSELQQLSARLLEIEEEDRRNLSRELHDEIGQALALLQIEVSTAQTLLPAQPEAARERLRRARQLAEQTVQTVRDISLLLRPPLLDDLGLTPALQYQLEGFLRRSGVACEFSEDGVSEDLPDPVKTCVYRVVQEALHNCEKHSGARTVRVRVSQSEGALTAEVEDDGRGFTVNEQGARRGLGLLGMRERASIAGGSLTIDSAPGRGARIRLRIPVSPAARPAANEVIA